MCKLIIVILFVTAVTANEFTNPIVLAAPDPWMVYYNGSYHFLATTWDNTITIRKASSLAGLQEAENKVVYTFEGHTAWAPEIHQVDGIWYLYYSACDPNTVGGCHRNKVAQSVEDDPMGPYEFKNCLKGQSSEAVSCAVLGNIRTKEFLVRNLSELPDTYRDFVLISTHQHTIGCSDKLLTKPKDLSTRTVDKTSFNLHLAVFAAYVLTEASLVDDDDRMEVDPSLIKINGKYYLLGSDGRLYIRELTDPSTMASGVKQIISYPTYSWERVYENINEGPEPLYHDDRIFVVYSASSCNTSEYKLGLLEFVGSDPLNITHWKKYPDPVFHSDEKNHVYGPGHNGFFKSPDGTEDWIVYHANDSPDSGLCTMVRSARAQKFTWSEDGLPVFGVPVAEGVKLQAPSGEE